MAKIYTVKGVKIKDGTTDEVVNSDGSDVAFGVDGDVLISSSIFAKMISNKWTCRYNSSDNCQVGGSGARGAAGTASSSTIIGVSRVFMIRSMPNYNVNCRLQTGYSILNITDGKVYEFDINSQSYIENTNKRITNG